MTDGSSSVSLRKAQTQQLHQMLDDWSRRLNAGEFTAREAPPAVAAVKRGFNSKGVNSGKGPQTISWKEHALHVTLNTDFPMVHIFQVGK
jgi:hypothetical protein